ncbi:MAG: hypothetical protein RJQ10_02855 [Haliea sp.]|uniref:hypothetical protein n=1 Tax=Haliea sp. TaxID=1932666 RepID=UPI0032EC5E54
MSGSMTIGPDRWLAATLLVLLLAGCGTKQVLVQSEFPPPVMNKLPLTIGVWYDEEFANHEFFDEAAGRAETSWLVNTGQAQVQLWDTLLKGMFRDVVYMNGKPGPGQMNPVVDAVLLPAVDELQYAIPAHTNVKVYEIWMRYRLQLVTTGGIPIADWTMPAYGKTPTAFMQSDEGAVRLAAIVALRDAGAHFASTFTAIPDVAQWLASLPRAGEAADRRVRP